MEPDTILQYTCFACILFIAYTYAFYPVILFAAYSFMQIRRDMRYLLNRRGRRVLSFGDDELPGVSFIVAAHNEEGCIAEKLANILALDYPVAKLQAIVVSDGSCDRTNTILKAADDPRLCTVLLPERRGKANALNQAVVRATYDILVFSDASTMFEPDAIRQLVRHFRDRNIGVVCGSLRFRNTDESKHTEGFYWKYESMLRLMEARLGATLTASGAIFAVRRECYRPIPANTILDDFITPMNARRLGFGVLYDPEAVGTEVAAETVAGEFTRRVRLAAGSFRALPYLVRTPLRGFALVAFLSHKLMRWMVCFPLVGLFACSMLLLHHPLYRVFFAAELAFLLWAGVGLAFRGRLQRIPGALLGYFLFAMNAAFLVGFVKVIARRDIAWHRTT